MAVKRAEEVEDRPDQQAQAPHSPTGRGGKCACHRRSKLLTDDRIQQRIFVGKVGIGGGAIDGRPLRDVLDTDRGKALLLEEVQKCLLQERAVRLTRGSTRSAVVTRESISLCLLSRWSGSARQPQRTRLSQHFSLCVVYPTEPRDCPLIAMQSYSSIITNS